MPVGLLTSNFELGIFQTNAKNLRGFYKTDQTLNQFLLVQKFSSYFSNSLLIGTVISKSLPLSLQWLRTCVQTEKYVSLVVSKTIVPKEKDLLGYEKIRMHSTKYFFFFFSVLVLHRSNTDSN